MGVVSFTFTEIQKDVNQDKIFLFILGYEFGLNYNQVLTLYNFSSDIFWSFINILKPILKIGDRKASQLKQSAMKVYFKLNGSDVELSDTEKDYLFHFSQYINDSFSNGEVCIQFNDINEFPIKARGLFYNSTDGREIHEIVLNTFDELKKYIDSIDTIVYKNDTYSKTSKLNYILEKYYGDLTLKEVKSKNVKELISMLTPEKIQEHFKELDNLYARRESQRESLVYRK